MTQRYLESCSYAAGRRAFLLKASALGAGLLLPVTGSAAQIKTLQGKVTVNGKPAAKGTPIKPGDKVATGAGAKLAFVIGQDAFLLRENSRLELQKAGSGGAAVVSGLRILTGALLAVFGKGNRDIRTATATIGIRGTGVYLESEPDAS